MAAQKFDGPREGYRFKASSDGLGYYKEGYDDALNIEDKEKTPSLPLDKTATKPFEVLGQEEQEGLCGANNGRDTDGGGAGRDDRIRSCRSRSSVF